MPRTNVCSKLYIYIYGGGGVVEEHYTDCLVNSMQRNNTLVISVSDCLSSETGVWPTGGGVALLEEVHHCGGRTLRSLYLCMQCMQCMQCVHV